MFAADAILGDDPPPPLAPTPVSATSPAHRELLAWAKHVVSVVIVVGPHASGKTTFVRQALGDALTGPCLLDVPSRVMTELDSLCASASPFPRIILLDDWDEWLDTADTRTHVPKGLALVQKKGGTFNWAGAWEDILKHSKHSVVLTMTNPPPPAFIRTLHARVIVWACPIPDTTNLHQWTLEQAGRLGTASVNDTSVETHMTPLRAVQGLLNPAKRARTTRFLENAPDVASKVVADWGMYYCARGDEQTLLSCHDSLCDWRVWVDQYEAATRYDPTAVCVAATLAFPRLHRVAGDVLPPEKLVFLLPLGAKHESAAGKRQAGRDIRIPPLEWIGQLEGRRRE